MAYVLLLENFGKKICSKQVVECDCKLPSLLSLIPMQSSGKHAQSNIATSLGEFQKLGTKRYQSDKLSFEFKIFILEMLILNSRMKSGSTAVLSERFPSECIRSISVSGMALVVLWGQAWALRCDRDCAWLLLLLCSAHGQGFSECSESVELHGAEPFSSCPGAPLCMLKEGSPSRSELSSLCCVSAASAAFPPQPRVWL